VARHFARTHFVSKRPGWEIGALLGLVVVCLSLRLVNLNALPIFVDEADTVRSATLIGAHPGAPTWLISLNLGVYPLFPWLVAPFTRLIHDPLLASRYAAAGIGSIGLIGVWATARLLWGLRVGLLAAVFYAVSPLLVFHNRMVVPDGLVATCGAGALFFAAQLSRSARTRDACALGLCLAAGSLTKIFALTLLLLPLLAVISALPEQRRSVRKKALAAALLGVLPLLWLLSTPQSVEHRIEVQTRMVSMGAIPDIIFTQLHVFAVALWTHITPPVLALALIGLWSIRRERAILLVGSWAILSSLLRVIAPFSYITPRHFVYVAIPVVILAARGLDELIGAIPRFVRHMPSWAVVLLGAGIAICPALAQDDVMITAPANAPFLPFDRSQYVTGWPSGYAIRRVVSYLQHQEIRRPVTVIAPSWYPTLGFMEIALAPERSIKLANIGFTGLSDQLIEHDRNRQIYILAFHRADVTYGPDTRHLRLVLTANNADRFSSYALYAPMADSLR